MVRKVLLFVSLSLFIFSSALAMGLSSSDMDRFIKTTKELTPLFDAYGADDVEDGDDDDFAIWDVEKAKQSLQDVMSGNAEMRDIVLKNGYPSVASYAEQHVYTLRAYMASTAVGQFSELESAMASMSPEQRQAFEKSPVFQMALETQKQLAAVPESHIQFITPYLSQLHDAFGLDADTNE